MIQSEVTILKSERQESRIRSSGIKGWLSSVEPLLTRLFDCADQLAKDIASGSMVLANAMDQKEKAFDRHTLMTSTFGLLIIFTLWQV